MDIFRSTNTHRTDAVDALLSLFIALLILCFVTSCCDSNWDEYLEVTQNQHPRLIRSLDFELEGIHIEEEESNRFSEGIVYRGYGMKFRDAIDDHITTVTFSDKYSRRGSLVLQGSGISMSTIGSFDYEEYGDLTNSKDIDQFYVENNIVINNDKFYDILQTKSIDKKTFQSLSCEEARNYIINCRIKLDFCRYGDKIYYYQNSDLSAYFSLYDQPPENKDYSYTGMLFLGGKRRWLFYGFLGGETIGVLEQEHKDNMLRFIKEFIHGISVDDEWAQ